MCAEPTASRDAAAPALSRRGFVFEGLQRLGGGGLGGVALAWMLAREARAAGAPANGATHFAPRARRVVQVFCAGGVSHLETFDYKPELERLDGKTLTGKGEDKSFFGQPGRIMKSVFPFRRRGRSGAWVSDLLPQLGGVVDDIALIHSMTSKSNNHTPATFLFNSGSTMNGFPCLGAWTSYGLGTLSEDLPTFVVLPDPRGLPAGGAINWTAGFLPTQHQGVAFRSGVGPPVRDLATPDGVPAGSRAAARALLAEIDREFAARSGGDSSLTARLQSYELAARMQSSIPEALEIDGESEETRRLYGLDRDETAGFGRSCLLARRLLERGVRFVQLFNGGAFGSPRINWDAHESVPENHQKMAAGMDRPVAGFIEDLKRRGLLADTLLLWSTEFGRGPVTQGIGKPGRDHHADAFTCFLAGAGVRKGIRYGASDEVGYFAVENPVSTYDLHATILHLLGIDHERLTFYHNGLERRLTDVHGKVAAGLLE
jgi:hypothetical protein